MSPSGKRPTAKRTRPVKAVVDRRNLSLLRTVQALRPQASEYRVYDDRLPGFGVHVSPAGRANWFIQYTGRGVKRRLFLGSTSVLTPRAARDLALGVLAAVAQGRDPLLERRQERTETVAAARARREAANIGDVAEAYLATLSATKSARWARDAKRIYELHLAKAFGAIKVVDVSVADVRAWHERLHTKPVAANRARAVLSAILARAIADEHRPRESGNPVESVPQYDETPRDRYLGADEWERLAKAIAAEREALATAPAWDTRRTQLEAILFTLLTGARVGSVLPRRWADVDWDGHVVRVEPAHKGTRRLYCGEATLALLRTWEGARGAEGFLFPGQKRAGRKPSPLAWVRPVFASLCDRAKLDGFTVHDLRRSFATVGGDVNVSAHLIGGLLSHVVPGIDAVYAHRTDPALIDAGNKISAEIARRLRLDGTRDPQILPIDHQKAKRRARA